MASERGWKRNADGSFQKPSRGWFNGTVGLQALLDTAGKIILKSTQDVETLTQNDIQKLLTVVANEVNWSKHFNVAENWKTNLPKHAADLHKQFQNQFKQEHNHEEKAFLARGINLVSQKGLEASLKLARLGGGDAMYKDILLGNSTDVVLRDYFDYQRTLPENKKEPRGLTQAKLIRTCLVADSKHILGRLELFNELITPIVQQLYTPKHKLSLAVQQDLYSLIVDIVILCQPYTRSNTPTPQELETFNTLFVELITFWTRVSCYLPADIARSTKDYSSILMLLGTEDHAAKVLEILLLLDTSLPEIFENEVAAKGKGLFAQLFAKLVEIVKEQKGGPATWFGFMAFIIVSKRAKKLYEALNDTEAQMKLSGALRLFVVPDELLVWFRQNGAQFCGLAKAKIEEISDTKAMDVLEKMSLDNAVLMWEALLGGGEDVTTKSKIKKEPTQNAEQTLESLNAQLFETFGNMSKSDDLGEYNVPGAIDDDDDEQNYAEVKEEDEDEDEDEYESQFGFKNVDESEEEEEAAPVFIVDKKKRKL